MELTWTVERFMSVLMQLELAYSTSPVFIYENLYKLEFHVKL